MHELYGSRLASGRGAILNTLRHPDGRADTQSEASARRRQGTQCLSDIHARERAPRHDVGGFVRCRCDLRRLTRHGTPDPHANLEIFALEVPPFARTPGLAVQLGYGSRQIDERLSGILRQLAVRCSRARSQERPTVLLSRDSPNSPAAPPAGQTSLRRTPDAAEFPSPGRVDQLEQARKGITHGETWRQPWQTQPAPDRNVAGSLCPCLHAHTASGPPSDPQRLATPTLGCAAMRTALTSARVTRSPTAFDAKAGGNDARCCFYG